MEADTSKNTNQTTRYENCRIFHKVNTGHFLGNNNQGGVYTEEIKMIYSQIFQYYFEKDK